MSLILRSKFAQINYIKFSPPHPFLVYNHRECRMEESLQSHLLILLFLKPNHNMYYLSNFMWHMSGFFCSAPPTKKWLLLQKIMILKSPNFVTFPMYLWPYYDLLGAQNGEKRFFFRAFLLLAVPISGSRNWFFCLFWG